MVARPPLTDLVQRADADGFVESTRCEYVVKLDIGPGSNSAFQPRPCHQSEFQECESHASRGPISRGPISSGGGTASCSSATSAPIRTNSCQGACFFAMFQLTAVTSITSSSSSPSILFPAHLTPILLRPAHLPQFDKPELMYHTIHQRPQLTTQLYNNEGNDTK